MVRAILPDDELECDHYERDEVGFVPYHNLHAIVA